MDLEIIMLSKLSHTDKIENHMISLKLDIKLKATKEQEKHNFIDTENSLVVTRGKESR